jgi:flagellar L-ring protein precursor FlgH
MRHLRKAVFSSLCGGAFLLTGCATTHHAVSDPAFAAVRPVASLPMPVTDGAIFKSGYNIALFEDPKAHRIGDVITIILQEQTNASKKASTTTAKDAAISLAAPTVFGKPVNYKGTPILSADVSAERDFTGEGDSTQSNSLTGRITVTIADVLPNGNLMVRGEKLLTLNQGSEHVRISGIVRAADITPDNTVLSSQVADAHIVYGGQGVLADANSKGWLSRVFDSSWWPF